MVSHEHTVVDLGEDEFTVGRLHPMMDNDLRIRRLQQEADDPEVAVIKVPGADSAEAIDHAARLAGERRAMMVVHTVLVPDLRHRLERHCAERGIVTVDLVGGLLDVLGEHLGAPDHYRPGLYRRLHHEYFQRVSAIDFAVRHDDGQRIDQVDRAEVVLLGVSRTGKTPLSMFLAMQGWKVANVPLVPGVTPPRQLDRCDPRRLVGLTITPELLVAHRTHRERSLGTLPDRYAEPDRVFLEVEEARRFFRKRRIPTVDVTNKPIEASARDVVGRVTRRLGVENVPGHEL
jgi:regulator of PEP synthase PpsR (kinase-PPPase family)